jgi:tagatose 1,6-diphosphate aldolase
MFSASIVSDVRTIVKECTMFDFLDPDPLYDHDLQLVLAETYSGNAFRDFVPAYRFHMRHAQLGSKMGEIELRIGVTPHLVMHAGQIGYEVFPAYRGHHYAARSVQLLLPLAMRHGLQPLWITCNPDNYASRRTCELAGFELVEIVNLPPDSDLYRSGERQKCRYRRYLSTGLPGPLK